MRDCEKAKPGAPSVDGESKQPIVTTFPISKCKTIDKLKEMKYMGACV